MSANATTINMVWLVIFRAQEPMQYEKVCAALPELSRRKIGPALSRSYRLGYFERGGKCHSYAYAVTPRCNIPPGIRVLDVLEAAE